MSEKYGERLRKWILIKALDQGKILKKEELFLFHLNQNVLVWELNFTLKEEAGWVLLCSGLLLNSTFNKHDKCWDILTAPTFLALLEGSLTIPATVQNHVYTCIMSPFLNMCLCSYPPDHEKHHNVAGFFWRCYANMVNRNIISKICEQTGFFQKNFWMRLDIKSKYSEAFNIILLLKYL